MDSEIGRVEKLAGRITIAVLTTTIFLLSMVKYSLH